MAIIQKNAPQKQGNIFRQNVMIYGFIELDACGFFWIGLDLDWFFVWIKIGFGFWLFVWIGFSVF
jgi:hypothetical protein